MAKKKKVVANKLDIHSDDIVTVKEGKTVYRVKATTKESAILTDAEGKEYFHRIDELKFAFPLEVGKRYFFTPRPHMFDRVGVFTVTDICGRVFRLNGRDTVSLQINQFSDIILIDCENLALH